MGSDLRDENGGKAEGGGEKLHRKAVVLEYERPDRLVARFDEVAVQSNFSSRGYKYAHRTEIVATPSPLEDSLLKCRRKFGACKSEISSERRVRLDTQVQNSLP